MKGLIIWAHSTCRSQIHLYDQIAKLEEFPVKIALYHCEDFKGENGRADIGFVANECPWLPFVPIGNNYEKAKRLIKDHSGWNHLIADYQKCPIFRWVCSYAQRQGEHIGIISEAPCNMAAGLRRVLKAVYMKTMLPIKVRRIVQDAEFIANLSGDNAKALTSIGWSAEKIIPFGYYPPPPPPLEIWVYPSNGQIIPLKSYIRA